MIYANDAAHLEPFLMLSNAVVCRIAQSTLHERGNIENAKSGWYYKEGRTAILQPQLRTLTKKIEMESKSIFQQAASHFETT